MAATVLSVIVPTLNEAGQIGGVLASLAPVRERGHEVILADGGSDDGTVELASVGADRVVVAPRGRGSQMNAGAAIAKGDVLVFLHADTRLPEQADELILAGLYRSSRRWGRFDVAIEGSHLLLKVVAWSMNLRSRLTGISTGDQAIFVRRDAFEAVGGFPDIDLMEDIVISKRLKKCSPPLGLRQQVVTSGRRWKKQGVLRTIGMMWLLRLAFFLGADPSRLASIYGYRPRGR